MARSVVTETPEETEPDRRLSALQDTAEDSIPFDFDYFTQRVEADPRGIYQRILTTIVERDELRLKNQANIASVQQLNAQIDELLEEKNQYQTALLRALNSTTAAAANAPANAAEKAKKSAKLPDPKTFIGRDTGEKNPHETVELEDWLAKIRRKLSANKDHYSTTELQMGYVQNMVGGVAGKHLAPRLRTDAVNPFITAEEMLQTLERAYGNPNKKQDASEEFRRLYQNNNPFPVFWADFQRLAAETEMPEATQLDELGFRVNADLQQALASVFDIASVYELAQRCITIDAKLQRVKKARGRTKPTAGTPGSGSASAPEKGVKPEPGSSPSDPRPPGKKPQYDNAEKQQLSREGKCFICKNPGHLARECPNRSRINEVDVAETPTSAPPASSNPQHSEN
jgi:hypothetical protein